MGVTEPVRRKAERIRLVVFDVDGVLTDGSILLGEDGTELKIFNVHDGLGLVMLRESGISVGVISSRACGAVTRRMQDLGIKHVRQGISDKQRALSDLARELNLEMESVAFVGDDLIDLPALAGAGMALAVANARPEVLACADWISTVPGGRGGVREVCEMLLESQGKLAACVDKYRGGTD
jgi:3-deoxy-D-manno-octulosonate 8-phosphate phosphatase (KDO 8-P phosphatase)